MASKIRFGDLEMDTVLGKNHKGAILTINDRATKLCWIRVLTGRESEPLAKQVIEVLTPLQSIIQTITVDNGKEFALHKEITQQLKISIYFAHPYHFLGTRRERKFERTHSAIPPKRCFL